MGSFHAWLLSAGGAVGQDEMRRILRPSLSGLRRRGASRTREELTGS